MTEITKQKLAEMSMKDLLALYNRLANKKTKRFESRAKGEAAVTKLLVLREDSAPLPEPRTVAKLTGDVQKGRPNMEFTVTKTTGRTKVQAGSLRGKILADIGDKTVSVKELQEKFGIPTRGAIQKLIVTGWLKRSDKP